MSKRAIADLLIKVGADNYEFQQKIQQTQNQLGKMSKQLTDVGKNLSLKLTAPLVAFGAFSLKAFDDSAKAAAKVEQGIKSTGGAAKLSFAELSQFAGQLQYKTLFEDDYILNNATAQLLTFTHIAGANFKRTQAVALDLATVLDGDLKSASIQLGKALNDPVKNLSALSRSGIQFSKEQKQVINTLAETGRLAEAQAVILDELERQYGGQAEAAAKVGLGSLTQLKNLWGDFMEQIGAVMLPMTNKLIGALRGLVEWLMQLSPTTKQVIVVVAGLAAAIGPVLITLGGIVKLLPLMKAGFMAMVSPMGAVLGLFALLATAALMYKNSADQLNGVPNSLASEWIAEGRYKDGDQDRIKSYIAEYEKKQAKAEAYYSKLGALRSMNADYRAESQKYQDLIAANKEVLRLLDQQKQTQENAAKQVQNQLSTVSDFVDGDLQKLLAGLNGEKAKNGLIPQLEEQIKKLKESLAGLNDEQSIAAINSQIEQLTQRLNYLNGVTSDFLKQKAEMAAQSEAIQAMGLTTTLAPKIEVKQANPLVQSVEETTQRIKESFDRLTQVLGEYGGEYLTTKYTEVAQSFNKKGKEFASKMAESVVEIVGFVKQSVGGIIEGVFQSIFTGMIDMFSGSNIGEVLNNILNSITTLLGNFIVQMAIKLMLASQVMIAFKEAVEKFILANPYVALAIAAGMLATGLLLKSALQNDSNASVPKLANGGLAYGPTYAMVGDNPGARVDPEVIAPLSKLKALLPNGAGAQNIALNISGELKARGSDLVLSLSRQNFRTKIVNG